MNTIYKYLFFSVQLLFFAKYCHAQNGYKIKIKEAEILYEHKSYLDAAKTYSEAFLSNNNLGLVRDRYEAARCWALGEKIDSAFYQLEKVAKASFGEYTEIISDTAFGNLHQDIRWQHLIKIVAANHAKQNPDLAWQFKRLNKPLVYLLDTINFDDQEPRKQINDLMRLYGANSPTVKSQLMLISKNDSVNQKKVRNLLRKHGWPSRDEVGEGGSETIFLVIQHAELPMQLEFLPIIRSAVGKKKLSPTSLATLEDRLALRQGEKQIYGSQLQFNDKTNKYYVQPLRDPENVDKRRAAIGLPPIKSYVIKWNIDWSIEQYEKDLSEIEKDQG